MASKYRVLHYVKSMAVGGIETWLINVLRGLDHDRVQFDFLVECHGNPGYEREVTTAGGRFFLSPEFRHIVRWGARLASVLGKEGPYDALHIHSRHSAAIPIAIAQACRVPVRIAHVHNVSDYHNETAMKRTYKRATKAALLRSASWILGCSSLALQSLYGDDALSVSRKLEVLPYGIDMGRFQPRQSRSAVAHELDVPAGHKILGHVGRFDPLKRHELLLDIFAELVARDDAWTLVLVGDGKTRPAIEQRAATLGVADRIRFTGVRSDVPDLMAAMDVFVLPSLKEGLGLVLVEAQALGTPCVMSDVVPGEAEVVPGLTRRVPVHGSVATWADAIASLASAPKPASREAHDIAAASPFNIERCVQTLLARYYGVPGLAGAPGQRVANA